MSLPEYHSDISVRDRQDMVVDFDEGIQAGSVVGEILKEKGQTLVDRMRALYRDSVCSPMGDSSGIPKVIHQIWLGGNLPEKFARMTAKWPELHPDWEYRLWTDSEVADLDFENRDLFDDTDCWGEKTDILRVEILRRFGGVYVDTDYELLKPLDSFHERFGFYTTVRAIPAMHLWNRDISLGPVLLCNSIVGAREGHPILDDYLARVRANMKDRSLAKRSQRIGSWHPLLLTKRKWVTRLRLTGLRTYQPFTQAVVEYEPASGELVAPMPPVFFNPIDVTWGSRRFAPLRLWSKLRASKRHADYVPYESNLKGPRTYAVHHGAGSWL